MYTRNGLHLSEKGAEIVVDNSGMGSITTILVINIV